jgi:hypothetical protein
MASEPRIDHIILGAADLDRATEAMAGLTGVRPIYGGKHPTGTHNALLSLGDQTYLELVAVQPGAAAPSHWPQLATLQEPTPIGWAVGADDPQALRGALEGAGFELTAPQAGSRATPAGDILHWQVFRLAREFDGAPFFITWDVHTTHPSKSSPPAGALTRLSIGGEHQDELIRLREALGLPFDVTGGGEAGMTFELSCPTGPVLFRAGSSN